ncbi:MAG: UDP-N-acetylmuramoyl-L-alanine--D-glutamate ligase [Candidatus Gottesmanbacteria bacterium]
MSRFTGKTIAVVGLSIEGKDTIDFLLHEGCTIICCDRRKQEDLADVVASYSNKPVAFYFGDDYLSPLLTADVIIRTPGMSLATPELQIARKKDIEITSATKLFFELCPCPIIGVTGTKGKGTTSTLIHEMLKADGKTAYLGGNVGVPLLSKVRSISVSDWVVFELSSFQLEDMTVSPHIAVVLRITQDHLANFDVNATSYHESREEYVKAKSHIVSHQKKEDIAIINSGNETACSYETLTPATIFRFNRYSKNADCFVDNHTVTLIENGEEIDVCTARTVKIRGDHNLENIAAATLAARVAGVAIPAIQKAATAFEGLEHRLEFVKTIEGVSYYNDSFSTTPETTIAAIESFEEPKVLILGGSEKKSDFTEMGKRIASSNVIGAVVIGQMTERIVEALKKAKFAGTIIQGSQTMHEVINEARRIATPGSVVILTPACASFGMFTNYKERGKQFKHEILALS